MLKYMIMLLTVICLLVSCKAEAYSDTFDVTFYSGGGITALGMPVYECTSNSSVSTVGFQVNIMPPIREAESSAT